jgi:hypothetical protein
VKAQNLSIQLGLVICVAISLVGCRSNTAVPQHLIGVWKTSEPRFANCQIEFIEGLVILGLMNGEEQYNSIQKVESVEESGRSVLYSFHYRDAEGRESKLTFLYEADSGGTIQLKNHTEIWKKTDKEGARDAIHQKKEVPHQ